jgi:hypothetical protein
MWGCEERKVLCCALLIECLVLNQQLRRRSQWKRGLLDDVNRKWLAGRPKGRRRTVRVVRRIFAWLCSVVRSRWIFHSCQRSDIIDLTSKGDAHWSAIPRLKSSSSVLDPCFVTSPPNSHCVAKRFKLVASNWLYWYQEWTKVSWGPHVPAAQHTRTMRDDNGEEELEEEEEELRAVRTMTTIWPSR